MILLYRSPLLACISTKLQHFESCSSKTPRVSEKIEAVPEFGRKNLMLDKLDKYLIHFCAWLPSIPKYPNVEICWNALHFLSTN